MTSLPAPRGFFTSLDRATQNKLTRVGRLRSYEAGEVIYRQGEPSAHVRLLMSGTVKLTARARGRETLLEIRVPGDLLGEREVLKSQSPTGRATHHATATTLRPTRVAVVSSTDFAKFIKSEPSAWPAIAQDLETRLSEAESRISGISAEGANRRLARAILALSMSTAMAEVKRSSLEFSQAELASWIGVSRETVERVMRDWRKRGIIETGYRRITVLRLDTLMSIAGMHRAPVA